MLKYFAFKFGTRRTRRRSWNFEENGFFRPILKKRWVVLFFENVEEFWFLGCLKLQIYVKKCVFWDAYFIVSKKGYVFTCQVKISQVKSPWSKSPKLSNIVIASKYQVRGNTKSFRKLFICQFKFVRGRFWFFWKFLVPKKTVKLECHCFSSKVFVWRYRNTSQASPSVFLKVFVSKTLVRITIFPREFFL